MSEFEEKLGSILGNQDAMAQIMALAQSLSGQTPAAAPGDSSAAVPSEAPVPQPSFVPVPSVSQQPSDPGALLETLGNLDPKLIQAGMTLLSEFSGGDDQKTALLLALKPFLKEERCAKIDRAVQIARLSRVLRVAFQLFKGRGNGDV